MKRNKIAALLLGMGLMAGALALPFTVPTTTTYAAAATEQIIGHGEWKQEDGKWYYYQDGKMLKNCWVKDGIDWYLLNEDGSMKSDELIKVDNDLYYFRTWGGMQYNNWYTDADGNRYYFRSWGAAHNTGWMQIGGEWYYFDKETCKAHTGSLEKIDKDLYSFESDGKMVHDSWKTIDGSRYYFRSWGGAHNTGWMQISGEWYYFDKGDCKAHTGSLEKIDNDLFSFDSDGKMLHDCWQTVDGARYYFRSWGAAHNTGWMQINGEWYYFDKTNCKAHANTIERLDNDIFAFAEDGKMLHDCWMESDGINYYFRSWGAAYHDQTVTIDGKEYVFDSNGNGTLKDAPTPEPTATPKPTDTPKPTPTATPEPTPEVVKVNKVTVSGNQNMTVGDTQKLTVTVAPENATNKKVTYKSSDSAIASVSADGTVTASKAGTVTVTATAADGSGVSGSIQITIKDKVVEASEVYIVGTDGELGSGATLNEIGQTAQLNVKILPENTTDKSVTWWTDEPEIATIDQNGVVTAVSEGSTYVHVKTSNGLVNTSVIRVTLPKTDEDYLNEIIYDEEMSRQVFDLVNQQRVLEGHLEMEWSDGFDKDQAIAVAGNNLLRYMKGEDDFDSLSDHNGSQNGIGGAKYNLTAEDIFNGWMDSAAHKANQMNDDVKSSAYVVLYRKADNGEYLFSGICTLSFTEYDPANEIDYVWNGDPYMEEVMTKETYDMLLSHFKK